MPRDLNKTCIKIKDDPDLRAELVKLYTDLSHEQIDQWAMNLIQHILSSVDLEDETSILINEGLMANENYFKRKGTIHEIRTLAFKIHRLAKNEKDLLKQVALRTIGQGMSTGHMKEHALVASDYGVKLIGLITQDNIEAIRKERKWQVDAMKNIGY